MTHVYEKKWLVWSSIKVNSLTLKNKILTLAYWWWKKYTVVKYASIQIRRYRNLANLCVQNGRTFIMGGKYIILFRQTILFTKCLYTFIVNTLWIKCRLYRKLYSLDFIRMDMIKTYTVYCEMVFILMRRLVLKARWLRR